MKYVKMEYPNGTIHNTLVMDFNHSNDKDVDYIDYYDMTDDKRLYSIVKNENGKYFKDSSVSDYTYDELSENVTKKDLNELPEEMKNYKENTKDDSKYELNFEVYNTDTGYFIASTIAEAFHLPKKYRTKKINNVICVPVTEEEINRIEVISNQGIPTLKHVMVNELDHQLQTQTEFIVHHIPDIDKYFINEEICRKYNVGSGIHFINGELCKQVKYNDIKEIEEKSKEENPCLKATIKDLVFAKQIVEIYQNEDTNKLFVKDDICNQNNIGKGYHYIDNILYKEINNDELLKLQNSNYEIKYKKLQFQKLIIKFIVYVDENAGRYFIENETSAKLGIGRGTHFIGSKKCKEVTLKEIKEVVESSLYGSIQYEPNYIFLQFEKNKTKVVEKEEEQTIVYKDKNNNNKLYAKKEDCDKYNIGNKNSFKYINNQECYEISLIELTRIKNPVVRTVYLLKEVDFEIVKDIEKETYMVCNYEDYKFIEKEIANKYNIDYSTVINVDGKKFVEVNEADLNKIDIIRKDVNIKPTTNDKEEVNNMLDEVKEDNNSIDDIKKIK